MRQLPRGTWQACSSKSVCTKPCIHGGSRVTSRAHTKAANRHSGLGALAIPCLITDDQHDLDKSDCRWEVQVTQKWDAVRRLGEVSLLYQGLSALHSGLHMLSGSFCRFPRLRLMYFTTTKGLSLSSTSARSFTSQSCLSDWVGD